MVLRLANGQLESSARCPNIKKSHCKLEFLFFFFFFYMMQMMIEMLIDGLTITTTITNYFYVVPIPTSLCYISYK